ncbi:hypothetical protein ACHAXT_009192 [Thalassiosira profunda]
MSGSSCTDSSTRPGRLPQHLLLGGPMPPRNPARRRRRGSSCTLALACGATLLAASPAAAFSLSMTAAPSAATKSLVDRARMIRELPTSSERRRKLFAEDDSAHQQVDRAALSAALFDDGFNNSLESALSNRKKNDTKKGEPSSAKARAEEFDRLMAEDADVASLVQAHTGPGSLVDAVQNGKGAEVDAEMMLQREAADRRRRRLETNNEARGASLEVPAEVARRTKLASPPSNRQAQKKSSLLTKEQEYSLARTVQAGARVHKLKAEHESAHSQPLSKKEWARLANMSPNDLRKLISDYRTAKQELVASNLGLVHAVVRSYERKAKYKGVDRDELVQEGSLGLIRAAELFDPEKGLRFSTYATIWIKGVLSNGKSLDEVISLPNRERVLSNKVRNAWEEMGLESEGSSQRGHTPTVAAAGELAERLGMKPDAVATHLRRMHSVSSVLSLDYQYSSTSRSGYAENNKQEALMASSQFGTDADLAEKAQLRADVVAGLVRNLSEREATLMRLRYGLEDGTEYTIKECAEKMGINRETARLLQHACLRKLREASNMESLQEYLLTVA